MYSPILPFTQLQVQLSCQTNKLWVFCLAHVLLDIICCISPIGGGLGVLDSLSWSSHAMKEMERGCSGVPIQTPGSLVCDLPDCT